MFFDAISVSLLGFSRRLFSLIPSPCEQIEFKLYYYDNNFVEHIQQEEPEVVAEASRSTSRHDINTFAQFRIHYLIVFIAIMLADGLQGTHLYALYEGYNYNVANLYASGFAIGALSSPFIGPLVDKFGRRRSALVYCFLEIVINIMEQYNCLMGLIASRVIGGITTNLLFSVFESWLVTEHRKRGFSEDKLELIMRDSVVISNITAIASGFIAHLLASTFGPVGPFEGAVLFTFVGLVLVWFRWEENYGSPTPGRKNIIDIMREAINIISSDSKICRIGAIQGLTEGALQTFIFLWCPVLLRFSSKVSDSNRGIFSLAIDSNGEPAYGLIFGAFMACGALGGWFGPIFRKILSAVASEPIYEVKSRLSDTVLTCQRSNSNSRLDADSATAPCSTSYLSDDDSTFDGSLVTSETVEQMESGAVALLAALCFAACSFCLFIPVTVSEENPHAFPVSLVSFLCYEFFVGVYMPCEGVLRTIYMPNNDICTLMTTLRLFVNVTVSIGVVSTNYIPMSTVIASCSAILVVASILQFTLVSETEWTNMRDHLRCLFSRLHGGSTTDSNHPTTVFVLSKINSSKKQN